MLILLLFVIVDVMCIFDYFLYLCCLYGSEIYLKLKTKKLVLYWPELHKHIDSNIEVANTFQPPGELATPHDFHLVMELGTRKLKF